MIQKCKFSKKRDFSQVVPNLAICLEDAVNSGVIGNTIDTTPYTKETEVSEVGRYVREPIDVQFAAMKLGASMSQTVQSEKEQA